MNYGPSERPIRVFVHLARGFGGEQWRESWERGEIIGLNEKLPYGYFWAEEHGCAIEHSQDSPEPRLAQLFRLWVRWLLGFDFIHAWRNRRGIRNADIVWTHTESQHLAVLLLLVGRKPPRRPKVIAQSIWLFDNWERFWAPRRWLFARLIAGADVLTVHSPLNLRRARELFPHQRVQLIPYGITADGMIRRPPHRAHRPCRVLSLGNDRHRDWTTLVAAVADCPDYELRIGTRRLSAGLTRAANVTLVHPRSQTELAALYDWADLVVVPLKPNLHASGITVVEEATVFGRAVVCTDTGGLTAYFTEPQVRYVPPGNPEALRAAIAALAADDAERCRMVERAQRRMVEGGLTSRHFAQRHAEISHELVFARAVHATAEQPRGGNPAARITL